MTSSTASTDQTPDAADAREGGCLCGELRFRVRGNGRQLCICHCRSCRLASGAPFVAWGTFSEKDLEIVSGQLATIRSSPDVKRGFCSSCGTAVTYRSAAQDGEFDLSLAVLDDCGPLIPAFHIWTSHKLSWVCIDDGLPRFEEGGPSS